MAKAKKEDAPQRLPGAEGECISREQQEILEWLRTVKFRKKLLGGVDEVQLWKKLEELYGLYANAIRAERARYDALLEKEQASHRAAPPAAAAPLPGEPEEDGGKAPASPAGRGLTAGDKEGEGPAEGGGA